MEIYKIIFNTVKKICDACVSIIVATTILVGCATQETIVLKQPFVSVDKPLAQINVAVIRLIDSTDVKHCRGGKPRLWAIDQVELYQNYANINSLFVEEGKRNLVLTCHQLVYSGATGGCQSEAHLLGRRGPGVFIGAQDYPIKLSAGVTYNISCEHDLKNTSHYHVTQVSGN